MYTLTHNTRTRLCVRAWDLPGGSVRFSGSPAEIDKNVSQTMRDRTLRPLLSPADTSWPTLPCPQKLLPQTGDPVLGKGFRMECQLNPANFYRPTMTTDSRETYMHTRAAGFWSRTRERG